MAALTAASVTYTVLGKGPGAVDDNGQRQNRIKLVFGDGTSTYPTGGIPLSNLSKWGFPNTINEVILEDASSGDGFLYKWAKVANTLRIYESPATAGLAPLTEVTTAYAPASGTTLYVQVRGH